MQTSKVSRLQAHGVIFDISLFSSHFSSGIVLYSGDLLYVKQAIDRFTGAADHNFNCFPLFNHEYRGFFEF